MKMKREFALSESPFEIMSKESKRLAVINALLVVDRDKEGKKISDKEFKKRVKETEDLFLELFGGYTNEAINHGKFRSPTTGKVMKETVARIVGYVSGEQFNKNRQKLQNWIAHKKKEWNQEAIGYEFEGDLYYL